MSHIGRRRCDKDVVSDLFRMSRQAPFGLFYLNIATNAC